MRRFRHESGQLECSMGYARSERSPEILRRIESHDPEVICLTETDSKRLLSARDAATRSGRNPTWGPVIQGRRKVLLWSRQPWRTSIGLATQAMPPGRFIPGSRELLGRGVGNRRLHPLAQCQRERGRQEQSALGRPFHLPQRTCFDSDTSRARTAHRDGRLQPTNRTTATTLPSSYHTRCARQLQETMLAGPAGLDHRDCRAGIAGTARH